MSFSLLDFRHGFRFLQDSFALRVYSLLVSLQMVNSCKRLVANFTHERLVPGVGSYVSFQLLPREETFRAVETFMRENVQVFSFPTVREQCISTKYGVLLPVIDQSRLRAKAVATIRTQEILFTSVNSLMNFQLLCNRKLPFAQCTLKGFSTS